MRRVDDSGLLAFSVEGRPSCHFVHKYSAIVAYGTHYNNISKQLDAKHGGERLIYRLARSRQWQTKDVEKFYGVNDEHGQLITDHKKATKRWCDYFEKISTEEFGHPPIPQLPPTCGPIQPTTVEETMTALKSMKSGKATGPDDGAAELWKSRTWNSAQWLMAFFNKVVKEKKTPVDWQRSTTIPIWKRKDNPADCANYRPIPVLSHSMKIFERIIDHRVRDIRVSTNQCGFVADYGRDPCGTPVDRKASRETEASAPSLPRSREGFRPRSTRSHLVRTALARSP
ncbi:hypothetical protein Y032_0075g944 [Ancylostoma ceylanicum]|uniref:Reverse transcriptase domain-containing protein n=1 Tax=Ancylostoma ceylanicum TaxID=53326 RepID=A0A016TW37_9BILA|nr:hypothetical protein Y032_0075g944 [Ancylostoma ceylanicum]